MMVALNHREIAAYGMHSVLTMKTVKAYTHAAQETRRESANGNGRKNTRNVTGTDKDRKTKLQPTLD